MTKNSILGQYEMNAAGVNINGNSSNLTGSCSLCGKKSGSKCDRCGDFYCSEFCQEKDWRNHRYICFPMPKLVKVGQIDSKNIPGKDFQLQLKEVKSSIQITNESCVVLTGFKSSNRCFIRSTNPSTTAEHKKILSEINEFGKTSSALSDKPKNNSWATTLRDGKWCRVQVLNSFNKFQCRVWCSDFGDIRRVYIKDLRKIEPSIISLPCFTHMVQLKGITSISTNPNLLKCLSQYVNKEYKVVFAKPDKCSGDVELFQWGTHILLNSIIDDLCIKHENNDKEMEVRSVGSSSNIDLEDNGKTKTKDTEQRSTDNVDDGKRLKTKFNGSPAEKKSNTKTSTAAINEATKNVGNGLVPPHPSENKKKTIAAPRQVQKPCLTPPFETIPLSENDINTKLFIMDNSYIDSGYIGCLLWNHYENLKSISKFLKEHNAGDQSYKPILNEYCLATYENEWYRAKVVEIQSEDKFLVVYIDFTNEMVLTSESIRRYPMSLNFPCYTTLCAIDGLPEVLSDKIQKFLELNCVSFQFLNIDSVRIENDIRYIKSNELLNKMRDSKLL